MSRRTRKGIELERKHQQTYERWWLGKTIEGHKNDPKTGEKIKGVVTWVSYIGNSVYGIVEIELDNEFKFFVKTPSHAYRPRKKDIKILDPKPTPEK